jgi:hypothetical protein
MYATTRQSSSCLSVASAAAICAVGSAVQGPSSWSAADRAQVAAAVRRSVMAICSGAVTPLQMAGSTPSPVVARPRCPRLTPVDRRQRSLARARRGRERPAQLQLCTPSLPEREPVTAQTCRLQSGCTSAGTSPAGAWQLPSRRTRSAAHAPVLCGNARTEHATHIGPQDIGRDDHAVAHARNELERLA